MVNINTFPATIWPATPGTLRLKARTDLSLKTVSLSPVARMAIHNSLSDASKRTLAQLGVGVSSVEVLEGTNKSFEEDVFPMESCGHFDDFDDRYPFPRGLVGPTVIITMTPDDQGLAACKSAPVGTFVAVSVATSPPKVNLAGYDDATAGLIGSTSCTLRCVSGRSTALKEIEMLKDVIVEVVDLVDQSGSVGLLELE